jgi:peptidoglycan pentaglycine glycine transferase (the first glycine)
MHTLGTPDITPASHVAQPTHTLHSRQVSDPKLWNAFVASLPTSHICQTYEWPDHVSTAARERSLRLGTFDGDRLVAAVALVWSQTGGVPGVHAPFYYAPRGPLCADAAPALVALTELVSYARHEAARAGAFMVRFEPNIAEDGEESGAWAARLRAAGLRATPRSFYPRSAWVTDIAPGEDALLAGMSHSWRYGIRLGTRLGVTVRECEGHSAEDFAAFYALLTQTGGRDRFYVYPPRVYRDMLDQYAPAHAAARGTAEMALFLAERDGVPVAAATVALLGGRAWYMHGALAGDAEQRKSEANRVLLWHCIRWAKRRGATTFDWRSIPDAPQPGRELYGVYAFKRGFGGRGHRVMPSHDLVLRPAIYWPYLAGVTLRHHLHELRRRRFEGSRSRRAPDVPAGARRPGAHQTPGERHPRPGSQIRQGRLTHA